MLVAFEPYMDFSKMVKQLYAKCYADDIYKGRLLQRKLILMSYTKNHVMGWQL
jgi:hypothetical protein